ncbi:MAG: galactose-1-phosphate uridylyltransferase [Deltaproteobacteria bacterium]|nr:galactose-1-phosphate uridylyltransferase [Deltaproteobacteria bacterium]
MYRQQLTKIDGRKLILYARHPMEPVTHGPSPIPTKSAANPHLRWHPLRGEWVTYATHRQDRTFLPPAEYSPLTPSNDPNFPTELPLGDYEVAVFDNLFPSLSLESHDAPALNVPTRPALGACEVVVFTQDPKTSLASLQLSHIDLLLQVWGERCKELGRDPNINYVMPFENRGVEVGVTLHHPHGQIYAYPVVPPIPQRELEQMQAYWQQHGSGLLEDMIKTEIKEGERIIFEGEHAVAFVPICARYAYEIWIAPKRPVASLAEMDHGERRDLALALKTVLKKFDALWNRPFPYLMVLHQAPTDGTPHPEAHVHFEIYPPYRTSNKLKYLAGTEIGAGFFAADSLPEAKAKELRDVVIHFSPEESR